MENSTSWNEASGEQKWGGRQVDGRRGTLLDLKTFID